MTKCNSGDPNTAYHQTKDYECTVERELGYNSCYAKVIYIYIYIYYMDTGESDILRVILSP